MSDSVRAAGSMTASGFRKKGLQFRGVSQRTMEPAWRVRPLIRRVLDSNAHRASDISSFCVDVGSRIGGEEFALGFFYANRSIAPGEQSRYKYGGMRRFEVG